MKNLPELTPVDRTGAGLCGGDSGRCAALALWHVAWSLTPPMAQFTLFCQRHMDLADAEFDYDARHFASASCDMPGTGWFTGPESGWCGPVTAADIDPRYLEGKR